MLSYLDHLVEKAGPDGSRLRHAIIRHGASIMETLIESLQKKNNEYAENTGSSSSSKGPSSCGGLLIYFP